MNETRQRPPLCAMHVDGRLGKAKSWPDIYAMQAFAYLGITDRSAVGPPSSDDCATGRDHGTGAESSVEGHLGQPRRVAAQSFLVARSVTSCDIYRAFDGCRRQGRADDHWLWPQAQTRQAI
jgi:hypothetical protein